MDMLFLSTEGIEDFKIHFDSYAKHYEDPTNQWFIDHWTKLGHLQKSKLDMPEINFRYADDMTTVDKDNVIAIHSGLRFLTPSQASDERLWAGLCHTAGWDFIQARRSNEIRQKTADKKAEFLMSIFFYKYGIKRSSYLNALAKYWWTGHMVYSPNDERPYAALDVLCKYSYFSSLMLFLSSSAILANSDTFNGVVDSFRKLQEENVQVSVDVWKKMTIYLNVFEKTVLLDALPREEITAICDKQLPRIIASLNH